MSVNVIQNPTNLAHYAKNTVPAFVIETNDPVSIVLKCWPASDYENFDWKDAETVFQGSYVPDFDYQVSVDFADCYASYLKTAVPMSLNPVFVQDGFLRYFCARVYDKGMVLVGTYSWFVGNAELHSTMDFPSYAASSFLTNQNIEKRTNAEAPEWLSWLDLEGNYVLKARFYRKTGNHVDATVKTDSAVGCYTVNVSYNRLIRMFSKLPNQLNGYYDLILFNGNTELARQRYIFQEKNGKEHYYLFVNALGGIDTLIADGANVLTPEVSFNYGRFGKQIVAIDDADNMRVWNQALTVKWRDRDWVYELLSAKADAAVYNAEKSSFMAIVVTDANVSMSDAGQLADASFDYLSSYVNAASQEKRRGTLLQSAAATAEELQDETVMVPVSILSGSSQDVTVYSNRIFVVFADTSSGSINYYINDTLSGSFTPGVDESPFPIELNYGDSVHFETGDTRNLELVMKYYMEWDTAWSDPVCVQVNDTYSFTWGSAVCVQEEEPYSYFWSNAHCILTSFYVFSWTDVLCVKIQHYDFFWNGALCVQEYYDTIEWEPIN